LIEDTRPTADELLVIIVVCRAVLLTFSSIEDWHVTTHQMQQAVKANLLA
jgi:hypothetical protein